MVWDISNAFERKHFVWEIFIDLIQTFICVDHGILLDKLNFYGIKIKRLSFSRLIYVIKDRRYMHGIYDSLLVLAIVVYPIVCPRDSSFLIAINDLP